MPAASASDARAGWVCRAPADRVCVKRGREFQSRNDIDIIPKTGGFEVEYGRPMGGLPKNRADGNDRLSGSFTAARVRADYL